MKVLLINNCHWLRGGSETVYFNTAKLLTAHGHEVLFLSLFNEQNIHTAENEYFVPDTSSVICKIKNYFSNDEAARKLEQIIEEEKPDIAHAHLFLGGISPSIIPVLHKHQIPFVHTVHDYRMVCPAYLLKDGEGKFCDRCKGGKFYNCTLHKCSKGSYLESTLMSAEMYYRNKKWNPARDVDGIVFVSNFSKNKHIEFDSRFAKANSLVLYNCPNERVIESLDIKRDTFGSYYLFYGRLSEEKGVYTLIRAFEQFPQLNLKIVGNGPLDGYLTNYCKEKKLNNIEFLGFKTGKELYDIVAKSKYVCVPSECYENNPMTIVESYTLGIPVIGASIGGVSEIVLDGETGFSFSSGSIESLKSALGKSIQVNRGDYNTQKHNALKFGQENFSRETHYNRLIEFYKQVLLINR